MPKSAPDQNAYVFTDSSSNSPSPFAVLVPYIHLRIYIYQHFKNMNPISYK